MGKTVEFESQITKLVDNKCIVWHSRHYAVDSQGEITFNDREGETRVQLVFSYTIKLRWVHKLAKVMNRLGFPSVTFDEGLRRIKNKIEFIYTDPSNTRDTGDDDNRPAGVASQDWENRPK